MKTIKIGILLFLMFFFHIMPAHASKSAVKNFIENMDTLSVGDFVVSLTSSDKATLKKAVTTLTKFSKGMPYEGHRYPSFSLMGTQGEKKNFLEAGLDSGNQYYIYLSEYKNRDDEGKTIAYFINEKDLETFIDLSQSIINKNLAQGNTNLKALFSKLTLILKTDSESKEGVKILPTTLSRKIQNSFPIHMTREVKEELLRVLEIETWRMVSSYAYKKAQFLDIFFAQDQEESLEMEFLLVNNRFYVDITFLPPLYESITFEVPRRVLENTGLLDK